MGYFAWRGSVAVVVSIVVLSGCGTENTNRGPASHGPTTTSVTGESVNEVCQLLTDLVGVQSRTDGADLESMRRQVPVMVEFSSELRAVAPAAIHDDIVVLADFIDDWNRTVQDPEFVLDPDTLYVWETGPTQRAGESVGTWAEANCEGGIGGKALVPVTLILCLPDDADSDDVQMLFDRTSRPSETKEGDELLEGIAGVTAGDRSLSVELDSLITPARKDELVQILGAPPVVRTIEADADESCR